jgi:hypothetical protein
MSGTVNNLQAVVIDGTNPLVTQMSTLTATVANHTSSISTLMSVTGTTAIWSVQINNNNCITGIVLNTDENQHSLFNVIADSFNIVDPANNTIVNAPFSVSNGNVYVNSGLQTNNYIPSNGTTFGKNVTGFKLGAAAFNVYDYLGSVKSAIGEFGGAISVMGYMLGDSVAALNLFAFKPFTTLTDGTWAGFYVGSDSGYPDATCISFKSDFCATLNSCSWIQLGYTITPKSATSNLDTLTYMKVEFYNTSGTFVDTRQYELPHGRQYSDSVHTSAFNSISGEISLMIRVTGLETTCAFGGYLRVWLANRLGMSSAVWFTGTGTPGGALTQSTTQPAGISGTLSDGGGTGGGWGSGCVPAGTMLLTTNGEIRIENATEGMTVIAFDDVTGEKITATIVKKYTYEARIMCRLIYVGGSLICSKDHRVTKDWIQAGTVTPGMKLQMFDGNNVVDVEVLENIDFGCSDVHHIDLNVGHIYIAGNILAHNLKMLTI